MNAMNAATDARIEAFRLTVERAVMFRAQLDTLSTALTRRDELTALVGNSGCGPQAAWLREELAASGHPLAIRIRHVQVERELRELMAGAVVTMRAALDAAAQLVTVAAGGADAVTKFPFAQRHLQELARHQSHPPPAVTEARFAYLRDAWREIDAAIAAVPEIKFETRQR